MRRFPLPGWVLALSIVVFIATWMAAPRRSVSGSDRATAFAPLSRPMAPPPLHQIQPLDRATDPIGAEDPFIYSHPFQIALTFDDGPHHVYTARLLNILRQYRVKATFFINGHWVSDDNPNSPSNRAILLQAREEGHLIGNHTFHHVNLTQLPPDEQTWEIQANADLIERITGERPSIFRPPYAVLSRHALAVLRQQGITIARWNSAALDEELHDAAEIAETVMRWIRHHQGGIVMLHDRFRWTVEAMPLLLRAIQRENCRRARRGMPTYQVVPLDSFQRPPAQLNASLAQPVACIN